MRGSCRLSATAIAAWLCACSSEDVSPAPLPPEPPPEQPPPSVSPPLLGLSGSASLAIDDDALYWFDAGDDGEGFVAKRAREGGETQVLSPATLSANPFVERDHRNVYWVDGKTGPFVRGVPLEGGEPAVIAVGNGGPPGFTSNGAVLALARFAADGTTAELVELDLAAERSRVLSLGYFALDVVIRGDDLWATACRADGVVHVDRKVGVRTALVDDAGCPFTLAVQGEQIVYVDFHPSGGSELRLLPLHGGAPSRALAAVDSVEFALDEGAAYAFAAGALLRIPLDGSEVQALAEAAGARGVAVDGARVHWLAPGDDGALLVHSVTK